MEVDGVKRTTALKISLAHSLIGEQRQPSLIAAE
jgi:hypothetical protein